MKTNPIAAQKKTWVPAFGETISGVALEAVIGVPARCSRRSRKNAAAIDAIVIVDKMIFFISKYSKVILIGEL